MNPHEIVVGKVTCAFLSERFNTFTTIVPWVVHLRGYLVDLHPFGGVGRQKRLLGATLGRGKHAFLRVP